MINKSESFDRFTYIFALVCAIAVEVWLHVEGEGQISAAWMVTSGFTTFLCTIVMSNGVAVLYLQWRVGRHDEGGDVKDVGGGGEKRSIPVYSRGERITDIEMDE